MVDAPGSRRMVKRVLATAINKELLSRSLLDEIIPCDDILALHTATPGHNRLSAFEIGDKLRAKTVKGRGMCWDKDNAEAVMVVPPENSVRLSNKGLAPIAGGPHRPPGYPVSLPSSRQE